MRRTEVPRFARDDNNRLSFSRNMGLIFPRHLHAGVERDFLHVQRSVRKGELVGILEFDRNPASGPPRTAGKSTELHIVIDADLRNLRPRSWCLAAVGPNSTARRVGSTEILDLSWIEAGGLEGLSDLGGNQIRGL